MLARIVGMALGAILATTGYVIAGWGALGGWATDLDLGPFEPHRNIVGVAAVIVGGLLIVAALTPRPKPKPRRKPEPLGLAMADDPPIAVPVGQWTPSVAPEPPAPVVQPAPATVEAAPSAAPSPTFESLRAELVSHSRAERWSEAAQALDRMKRAAHDDQQRAIAARDLGDFMHGQGRLDEAAEAYAEAVSFARDALRAAPDADPAIDLLAGSLSGVGDVAEAEGRLDEALTAFEESLALRRSTGGREAADPNAQAALSISLERLADVREDRGHRMRALALYRESFDVSARLAAADPARFGSDFAATRQRLAELEAKVGPID